MSLCGNNNPCPDLVTGQKCGIEYTGARYVPLFADPAQWDNTKAYEPLTIVLNQGNSYTSKTFVPIGVDIANENYWALTGNYNAQIEAYRQEVANLRSNIKYLGGIPKNYGALGDGTTDDTAAIQQCFNENDIIIFTDGVYIISDTLKIHSNMYIKGSGSVIIKMKYSSQTLAISNSIINQNNLNNVHFENIIFDGGSTTWNIPTTRVDQGNSMIIIENSDNLSFTNITFQNFSQSYVDAEPDKIPYCYQLNYCNNIYIENQYLTNIYPEGGWLSYCNYVNINNLTCEETAWSPFHIFYSNYVNLKNSVFKKTIRAGSTLNFCARDFVIENCDFINGSGLDLSNETSVSFIPGKGIIAQCRFSDTPIYNQPPTGTCENVYIQNCSFKYSTMYAVRLDSPLNCVIDNCEFISTSTTAGQTAIYSALLTNSNYSLDIMNNNFKESTNGVTIANGNNQNINLNLKDNYFKANLSTTPILLEGVFVYLNSLSTGGLFNLTVDNCEIENCKAVFYANSNGNLSNGSTHLLNNLVTYNDIILNEFHQGELFIENNIFNNCRTCFQLDGVTSFMFTNNIIKGADATANFLRYALINTSEFYLNVQNNEVSNIGLLMLQRYAMKFTKDSIVKGYRSQFNNSTTEGGNLVNTMTQLGIFSQLNSAYLNTNTSAMRPNLDNNDIGYSMFDTTLNKLIIWNGSGWVDVNGTTI